MEVTIQRIYNVLLMLRHTYDWAFHRLDPTMQDGNPANPTDLRTVPFLEVTGSTQVSVDTLKECDSSMCIPNLNVEMVNVTYE